MHTTISRTDHKINVSAMKYHAARTALVALSPLLDKEDWGLVLQPLKEEHIKAMKDLFEKETEGRKMLSWIWKTPSVTSNNGSKGNEDLHDCRLFFTLSFHGFSCDHTIALHTKWCKARAHKLHWEEEVELLDKEQRHILVFLNWQAS